MSSMVSAFTPRSKKSMRERSRIILRFSASGIPFAIPCRLPIGNDLCLFRFHKNIAHETKCVKRCSFSCRCFQSPIVKGRGGTRHENIDSRYSFHLRRAVRFHWNPVGFPGRHGDAPGERCCLPQQRWQKPERGEVSQSVTSSRASGRSRGRLRTFASRSLATGTFPLSSPRCFPASGRDKQNNIERIVAMWKSPRSGSWGKIIRSFGVRVERVVLQIESLHEPARGAQTRTSVRAIRRPSPRGMTRFCGWSTEDESSRPARGVSG